MTGSVLCAALFFALLAPPLLAVSLPPSPTVLNQAAAWAGWALVATYASRATSASLAHALRRSAPLTLPLAAVTLASLASWRLGALPAGIALSAAGTVLAAAAIAVLGAAMAPQQRWWTCWFGAWAAVAAVSGTIGAIQVFAPDWTDGEWLARVGGGRAAGNLRQPNHLATLLLWGATSVIALVELGPLARTRARRTAAWVVYAYLIACVMFTGSRTGAVGLLLLAVWGLADRRLSRQSRLMLLCSPLWFAAAWWGSDLWSSLHADPAVGVAKRLGQADPTSGRFQTWHNALTLIAAQPWSGVGFGEFNLAWTLTALPLRWPEFFDHTHNLPLQVLTELGVVAGCVLLAALGWALVRGVRQVWLAAGAAGSAARALAVALALMVLHSLLEYPLWYAHFLLPTAFACGVCLGMGRHEPPARQGPAHWTLALGVALAVGASVMVWDYRRVSAIFAPPDDEKPLVERIREGQRSWFFAHHADYARITALEDVAPPAIADFRRATHYLLDARLLTAWARAYAREGDVERARWIADRLRELKQPSAEPFFAPCSDAAVADKPFQCTPASRVFSWRDFR